MARLPHARGIRAVSKCYIESHPIIPIDGPEIEEPPPPELVP